MGSIKTLLTLVFFAVPVLEIYLLITVGGIIGVLPTIGLVVLTAVIGVHLLKQQGLATLNTVQTKLANGQMPAGELFTGAFLLVGGALLLTPGFFTDFVGFMCLLPPARALMIKAMQKWFLRHGTVEVHQYHYSQHSSHSPGEQQDKHTIEGEWKRED